MKLLIFLFWVFKWLNFVYGQYTYEVKYFDVRLDHFTSNNKTFPLRYFINDQYWTSSEDGPIMFYPGTEGSLEAIVKATGFLWEAAKKFKALVCFSEHRYYGKSMPFGNLSLDSIEHFQYLTIKQTLADFADLISYLKNDYKKDNSGSTSRNRVNPVIVIGGSYGGDLAIFMRMNYPTDVQGALASSAPIFLYVDGKLPCNGFYQGITSAFATSSKKCVDNIRKSWKALYDTMANDAGKEYIFKSWNLCERPKTNDDIHHIVKYVKSVYIELAMANYPYETDFLGPMAAHPVDVICKDLDKDFSSNQDLLTGLWNGIATYVNHTGKLKCYNMITSGPLADVGVDTSSGLSWFLQFCTELPQSICIKGGDSDMFEPNTFNKSEVNDDCYKQFKVTPKFGYIEKEFHLNDVRNLTNLIVSDGSLDPWKYAGFTKEDVPLATVIHIEGGAHHLDLRSTNLADPQSVTQARIQYQKLFRTWIQDFRKFKCVPKNEYDAYLESLKF